MDAATYETGFFSSPADLLTAARETNAQIAAIDSAIDGNETIPQSWWDAFEAFRSQWLSFYSDRFGGAGLSQGGGGSAWATSAAWFTTDLAAQLESYQAQVPTWADQARGYGAKVPGATLNPATGPDLGKLGLPSGSTVTVILVLLIVLALAVKLL